MDMGPGSWRSQTSSVVLDVGRTMGVFWRAQTGLHEPESVQRQASVYLSRTRGEALPILSVLSRAFLCCPNASLTCACNPGVQHVCRAATQRCDCGAGLVLAKQSFDNYRCSRRHEWVWGESLRVSTMYGGGKVLSKWKERKGCRENDRGEPGGSCHYVLTHCTYVRVELAVPEKRSLILSVGGRMPTLLHPS